MSQSTDAVFDLRPGASPLVLSLPHVGTVIPDALRSSYVERALDVELSPAGPRPAYRDGDIIIEDGTYGTEVYKLCQTEQGLEVLKKDVRVGMITKPGEYFGEMSFILNEPRSATIRSVGRSVVEVIPVQDGNLERLISENPEVANRIITTLAERLKKANLLIAK